MNNVLITGGTGAFGRAFAEHLLTNNLSNRVVIYSRDEVKQAKMAHDLSHFKPWLRFMIGDVRDKERLERAMKGVQWVVHAAALKRIEVGEYNPDEMVKTNVIGAMNVVEAATAAKVFRVVFLSSDKAYQPVSPYGQSKALAESIFLNANNMRGDGGSNFSVTRYGNVWGSTGSVVPTWRSLLVQGTKRVPVTDPNCTRFYMTMNEAVLLVMQALLDLSCNYKLYIPKLPAYRLGDLAAAMGAEMDVRGLPSWEKLHESMEEGNSSDTAPRMSISELKGALNA